MDPAHLERERLTAKELDPHELEHLTRCVRCRSDRRLLLDPDLALPLSAPQPESEDHLGAYELLGELGEGGMGRVYAARHPERGELLAIKVLAALDSRSARKRFLQEAKAQRSVVHENVLSVIDHIELPDGPALVLPLVRGPSLAALLERHTLDRSDAFALFRQICAGVAAIHEARIVHRDLKPSNVLLEAREQGVAVKVADFGLVKVLAESDLEALTRSGVQLGTAEYMAPEQRKSAKRIDTRADVWSLGAILYRMIRGRLPESPLSPEVLAIPMWGELLSEMLSEDPEARPPDAAAVLARLPQGAPESAALAAASRALAPILYEPRRARAEPGPLAGGRRFEIGGLLGSGGFGEVYRASMQSGSGLKQEVAVKLLRDPDPKALARLEREGELLSRLRHPSILRAYDLVRLNGQVALVTEYVAGMDLASALRLAARPEPRALLEVVSLVAEALDAVAVPLEDGLGPLVHRDIKPSNIRIGVHGEVKLLDFGVAWAGDLESTRGDSFIGSLPYMAPERFLGGPARPASDIYALGCVLYECLAGRPLHTRAEAPELFAHIHALTSAPEAHERYIEEALSEIEAPEEARRAVREMLAHAPEDRPVAARVAATCAALAARADGRPLKVWCRDRDWTETKARRGHLTGAELLESSGEESGEALSEEAPPALPPAQPSVQLPEVPPAAQIRRPLAGVLAIAASIAASIAAGLVAVRIGALVPVEAQRQVAEAPALVDVQPTTQAPAAPEAGPQAAPQAAPEAGPQAVPTPERVSPPRPRKPPAPAPEPPPAPEPLPAPAPPAPEPGWFLVDGSFAQIQLRDGAGGIYGPGEVPAGAYSVYAWFDGEWVEEIAVQVKPNQRVAIGCNPVRWICWQR